MPSVPISARLSPYVHGLLTERARDRDTSFAALVAILLTAAVDDADPNPKADGPLVAAVRLVLEETDLQNSRAAVHRELCLFLVRTVERKEPGYLAAIATLHRELDLAAPTRLQRQTDRLLEGLLS